MGRADDGKENSKKAGSGGYAAGVRRDMYYEYKKGITGRAALGICRNFPGRQGGASKYHRASIGKDKEPGDKI